MSEEGVKPNDVIQIRPNVSSNLGGCFMKVEEVLVWGVRGVVPMSGDVAVPCQVKHGDYARIGEVKWDV